MDKTSRRTLLEKNRTIDTRSCSCLWPVSDVTGVGGISRNHPWSFVHISVIKAPSQFCEDGSSSLRDSQTGRQMRTEGSDLCAVWVPGLKWESTEQIVTVKGRGPSPNDRLNNSTLTDWFQTIFLDCQKSLLLSERALAGSLSLSLTRLAASPPFLPSLSRLCLTRLSLFFSHSSPTRLPLTESLLSA